MNNDVEYDLKNTTRSGQGGLQVNFKRVAGQVIQFWYLIALCILIGLVAAYLVNRYGQRIYPVKASIIIRQSEENAGARFLYNNDLIAPFRNYFNEIYIMKSYPLLQNVIEDVGFNVSYYREGEIKITEYYDQNFPIQFILPKKGRTLKGKSFTFRVVDSETFFMNIPSALQSGKQKKSNIFRFNDTIPINGETVHVSVKGDVSSIVNKTFIVRFNDALALAKAYSNRLRVNWAAQGASIVDLEINGSIPQKEIDFLNTFIERYQQYDIEKKSNTSTRAIAFLDEQLLVVGDSLRHFEDQVEAFKRKNIVTNLEEETGRLYQQVQDLEDKKLQFRLLDNYLDYIIELLKREEYEGIFSPSSVGISDNVLSQLIQSLIQEQTEINLYKLNQQRGVSNIEENPVYQSKMQKIKLIKNDILRSIENGRKNQRINIDFINNQIKIFENRLSKLPGSQREFITIQRNYTLRENLYVYLLQKRTEAGLSRASTISDIVVVNPPMAGGLISPKTAQNYIIGFVSGLFFPLAIFILLELINVRVQSKEDIERITSVPVLGGIGHNPETEALIVYNKPRSSMAESFRALRSNLNYFTGNKDRQVFMITSSIPAEGKSFTTLNLATVFALAGKKTVIIGADLRKPKLYSEFNLNNSVGLSQFLSRMTTLDQILHKCHVENLYLIPGGPMPPNPSELLLRPELDKLMEELKSDFDVIIIDTPPLTLVTDAFVLSKHANHILFIVRQNFTPKIALSSLEDYYASGKLANISILFNDLRKSGLGYGYEGYGYGYGYGYGSGYGSDKKKNGSGYYADES